MLLGVTGYIGEICQDIKHNSNDIVA